MNAIVDPQFFLNQFEFQCKYDKKFNKHHDCSSYLLEMRKEIL
jgi:hypothetical protein